MAVAGHGFLGKQKTFAKGRKKEPIEKINTPQQSQAPPQHVITNQQTNPATNQQTQ